MSVRVHFRPLPNGDVVGAIDIPTFVGGIRVTGVGSWYGDAFNAASHVASQIVDNPVIRAVMPPQAAMAISAIRGIANAVNQGPAAIRGVMSQITGPGKQRLVAVLHKAAVARQRALPSAFDAPAPEEIPSEEIAPPPPAPRRRDHRAPIAPPPPPPPESDEQSDEDYDGGEG